MNIWKKRAFQGVICGGALLWNTLVFADIAVAESQPLTDAEDRAQADARALQNCLSKWGNPPFANSATFRRIKATVTVGGVGTLLRDQQITSEPELVLVSAVNVLGSANYELLNSQGWYCFQNNVNVLAKT